MAMSMAVDQSNLMSNQRVSVGADGKVNVDLTFVEEPLGLPAKEGYGWPQIEFNQRLGPDERYIVSRKLGWGISSSTWLAYDQVDKTYVALKILSGYYTELIQLGRVWELEALERVSSLPQSPNCLRLLSHFTFPGTGTAGDHLCIVTQLLGGDIKSLFNAHGTVFPLPLAKRILLHLLRGIAHAHSRGIVHTDLKHDNIFFDRHMSDDEIKELAISDPPRRHPPESSHDGLVQAAVSQNFPNPNAGDAMNRTFVLADFGSARPIFDHPPEEVCPEPLRPPEIVIGGIWNEKVDIWMFGCLVFEIVIGRALFKYEPFPKHKLDEPTNLLYQMICYTGEDFEPEQLGRSAHSANFFDSTCNLKADPPLFNFPFEKSIRNYKVVEEKDVLSTATLMRRCLKLDPAQRASASELLSDPFFDGVD